MEIKREVMRLYHFPFVVCFALVIKRPLHFIDEEVFSFVLGCNLFGIK